MPYNKKFQLQPSGYSKNNVSLKEQQQKTHKIKYAKKQQLFCEKRPTYLFLLFFYYSRNIFYTIPQKKSHETIN